MPKNLTAPFDRATAKVSERASEIKMGQRSPSNATTGADRQSDASSDQSSSGVINSAIGKLLSNTKQTNNKAQRTTKPMKSNKKTLDPDTNPALSKWFDKCFPERRLRNL